MATFHSTFVKNISFPALARRYGLSGVSTYNRELESSQYWSQDRLVEFQLEKLRALFAHAYETVPYYRDLFDNSAFVPERLASLDDVRNIPFLTKSLIRDHSGSLLSSNYSIGQRHFSETGGTTGVKMQFWRDNSCLAQKEAARYRFEKWTGWGIGERMGLIWPAQQDYVGHWTFKAKIKNSLYERQIVLPAAILDKETIVHYLELLKKKRPTMIRAFSSPIFEVAKVALDLNIQFTSIKGIVTTGELLYEHQRHVVERAFGCKAFDSYRCREVGPIAQECEEHKGLHINAECLFVEVVPSEQQTALDDGAGEIVVTDLLNYGMPLIRYKMGDMGILSDRCCSCGRGLPFLEKVNGRAVENLHAPNGKSISSSSLVLYLVDEAPGLLGQVQVIQDGVAHLLIRMTPDPPPTEEIKEYQRQTVKTLFGDEMRVSFEVVDEIKRSSSGKYQFTKYQVK